jgi:hypothetical protein
MGMWEAMELSRKAATRRILDCFLVLALAGSIGWGGFLLAGVGAIWTVPMGLLVYAIGYRAIFGDPVVSAAS